MHARSAGKAGRPAGKRDTPERCLLAAEQLFAESGFAGTRHRLPMQTLSRPWWIDLIRRGPNAGALGEFDAEMFVFSFTGAIAHFHSASPAAAAILSIAGHEEIVGRYRSWLRDSALAMLRGYSH